MVKKKFLKKIKKILKLIANEQSEHVVTAYLLHNGSAT